MKIFVGPFGGVMTGQRHCLEVAADGFEGVKRISVGGEGYGAIKVLTLAIWGMMKSLVFCIAHRERILYFTPSRSIFGFTRDLIIIWPFLLFKSKKIAHWHGATIPNFKISHPKMYQLFVRVYKTFSTHIVLTESMRSQVLDLCSENHSRIEVVSNFHDFSVSDSVKVSEKPIRVLYFSNVMPEKGAFDYIHLCSRVLNEFKVQGIEFHLAGPLLGITYQELNEAVAEAGLELGHGFYVHGGVYGEEKVDLLEMCDIFVFPSFYPNEAFPLVVLEAMAKGLCIIAYDHNYMSDILVWDCGILVKKRDVGGLVSEVIKLKCDSELLKKQKDKCRNLSKKYSKEKYVKRIRELVSFE